MLHHLKISPCTALLYITLYAFSLAHVLSTPVPIIVDPKAIEYLEMEVGFVKIHAAFIQAQLHLRALVKILESPTIHRDLLMPHCFGAVTEADVHIIVSNIRKLAREDKIIEIQDVAEALTPAHGGVWAYVNVSGHPKDPMRITFTTRFQELSLDDGAGIIIHEAAHILLDSYDWFLRDKPYTQTDGHALADYRGPPVMTGYEGPGLRTLAAKAPGVTKYNADAYAVAAILATRIYDLKTKDEIMQAINYAPAFSMTKPEISDAPPRGSSSQASSSHASGSGTSGGSSGQGKGKGKGKGKGGRK